MNSDMNNNKQTITSGDCYSQKGDDCFPISFGILREKGSYLPDLLKRRMSGVGIVLKEPPLNPFQPSVAFHIERSHMFTEQNKRLVSI